MKKIYRLVVGTDPRQLKFEFALWTRGMIRELIRREFGVPLSEVSVGRLLRKLGLSPQRPQRGAFQQDELLVVEWMAKDFPAIQKLAREQRAEIFFGDESSLRYNLGTTRENTCCNDQWSQAQSEFDYCHQPARCQAFHGHRRQRELLGFYHISQVAYGRGFAADLLDR